MENTLRRCVDAIFGLRPKWVFGLWSTSQTTKAGSGDMDSIMPRIVWFAIEKTKAVRYESMQKCEWTLKWGHCKTSSTSAKKPESKKQH